VEIALTCSKLGVLSVVHPKSVIVLIIFTNQSVKGFVSSIVRSVSLTELAIEVGNVVNYYRRARTEFKFVEGNLNLRIYSNFWLPAP
jgi:hypothetical protein